jgi:hypothetical protein
MRVLSSWSIMIGVTGVLLSLWILGTSWHPGAWRWEQDVMPGPWDNVSGLSFDGERLWITIEGEHRIRYVDPATGTTLRTVPFPAEATGGSAWDGKWLWQLAWMERRIYQIDPADGKILATFPSPGEGMCSGTAFDGRYLWVANWVESRVYCIDQQDGGRVIRYLRGDKETAGIAWDGTSLWVGVLVGTESHDEAPPFTGFVQELDIVNGEAARVVPVHGVGPGCTDWTPGSRRSSRMWWYDHFNKRIVVIRFRTEGVGTRRAGALLLFATSGLVILARRRSN